MAWNLLSAAAEGDRVFIRHFHGDDELDGAPGIWARVAATSASPHRPEHYLLRPDRGTDFEHTATDWVYISEDR